MVLAHMGLIDPRAYMPMAAILRQPIADGTLHNPVGELPRLHAPAKSTDTHGLPVARVGRQSAPRCGPMVHGDQCGSRLLPWSWGQWP